MILVFFPRKYCHPLSLICPKNKSKPLTLWNFLGCGAMDSSSPGSLWFLSLTWWKAIMLYFSFSIVSSKTAVNYHWIHDKSDKSRLKMNKKSICRLIKKLLIKKTCFGLIIIAFNRCDMLILACLTWFSFFLTLSVYASIYVFYVITRRCNVTTAIDQRRVLNNLNFAIWIPNFKYIFTNEILF